METKLKKLEEIKIKKLKDVILPKKFSVGDWIDLRCAEDIELKKGEFKLIPLGIAMKLPEGYEAIVAPRSSTFKKYKILQANSIGVIDNSYSGDGDEWMFPAIAFEDTRISKNERICQFRLLKSMEGVNFIEVDKLDDKNRGGFGEGTKNIN